MELKVKGIERALLCLVCAQIDLYCRIWTTGESKLAKFVAVSRSFVLETILTYPIIRVDSCLNPPESELNSL